MSRPIWSLVGITEPSLYLRGLYIQNSWQPSENRQLITGEVIGRSRSPVFPIGLLIFLLIESAGTIGNCALSKYGLLCHIFVGSCGYFGPFKWVIWMFHVVHTQVLSVQFMKIKCSFSFYKGQETLIQVKHVKGWASYYYNYLFNDELWGYIF